MIAGEQVDHAVEVPTRAQNPRFIVDKAQLAPHTIADATGAAATTAPIPGGNA